MVEDLPNINSLYDYFYLDNTKINSFYAQLTGNGSIDLIKQTFRKSDTMLGEGTVGIPTVTGGKLGANRTNDTSAERHFKASDIMPREMMNRLDELGFIGRKLDRINLGRLVLLKGNLGVVDIGMIKEMIEPAINFYIYELESKMNACSDKTEKNQLKTQIGNFKKTKDDLIKFVKSVPFAIQCRFLSHDGSKNELGHLSVDEVWMTLNRGELVAPTYDINFKHGEFITGEWYLLGVLDALPNDDFTYNTTTSEIDDMVATILQGLREFVGRPKTSFGITPIAIFRNIEPHSEE